MWRRPTGGGDTAPATEGPAPGDDAAAVERSIWGPGAAIAPPTSTSPEAPSAPATTAAAEEHSAWRPSTTADPVPATPGRDTVAERPAWHPPAGPGSSVDGRPAPPPRGTRERLGGWWARGGVVAAVLVLVGTTITLLADSDSGDSTTNATRPAASTAPSTSIVRRTTTTDAPATTTSSPSTDVAEGGTAAGDELIDTRVLLVGPPDGFTAVNATEIDTFGGVAPASMMFVGDGATWRGGPWVRVGATGELIYGPATVLDIGGHAARAGRDGYGAELVVVDAPDGPLTVSAMGLPAGTAATVAAAVLVRPDGTLSVPAAGLPQGLRLADAALAETFGARGPGVRVGYEGPAGQFVALYATIADDADPLATAPFYLDDLTYVTVGDAAAVAGTFSWGQSQQRSVQWRHDGLDIELSSYDAGIGELVELATLVRTRRDGGWNERDWARAADSTPGGRQPPPTTVGEIGVGPDGETATVSADRSGDWLSWWADGSGQIDVGRYGQPVAAPVVLDVATTAHDPFSGEVARVVAIALGDASVEGATLRVRTALASESAGLGAEYVSLVEPLGPGDTPTTGTPADSWMSPIGFTHGAVVAAEWPQGEFVAELVAADGVTVLATATAADV